MYSLDLVEFWAEAEENLGLKNSMFFIDNGVVTQWYNVEEGEGFYLWIVNQLQNNNWFDEVVEKFFRAVNKKDKVGIFEGLTVFDEIDNHPEIANEDVLRRLKRVRESTHEIIYNLQ